MGFFAGRHCYGISLRSNKWNSTQTNSVSHMYSYFLRLILFFLFSPYTSVTRDFFTLALSFSSSHFFSASSSAPYTACSSFPHQQKSAEYQRKNPPSWPFGPGKRAIPWPAELSSGSCSWRRCTLLHLESSGQRTGIRRDLTEDVVSEPREGRDFQSRTPSRNKRASWLPPAVFIRFGFLPERSIDAYPLVVRRPPSSLPFSFLRSCFPADSCENDKRRSEVLFYGKRASRLKPGVK